MAHQDNNLQESKHLRMLSTWGSKRGCAPSYNPFLGGEDTDYPLENQVAFPDIFLQEIGCGGFFFRGDPHWPMGVSQEFRGVHGVIPGSGESQSGAPVNDSIQLVYKLYNSKNFGLWYANNIL